MRRIVGLYWAGWVVAAQAAGCSGSGESTEVGEASEAVKAARDGGARPEPPGPPAEPGPPSLDGGLPSTGCSPNVNCDDGNPCTADSCQVGIGCVHAAVVDGTSCVDQDACNGSESCQAGVCSAGAALDCDDGDPCTTDSCSAASGCQHGFADGAACDDQNPKTVNDVCSGGSCAGVDLCANVVCTAADQCRDAGTCDPLTGLCSSPARPDSTPCDDGNACTKLDACMGGTCVGNDPVACDAIDACHWPGVCDPHTGLCSTPAAPDGTECSAPNATGTCGGGTCELACSIGFADCNASADDGCETDLQMDAAHCGACGNACTFSAPGTTTTCQAGACSVASDVALSQAWTRTAYTPYLSFWKDGSLLGGNGSYATLISNHPTNPVASPFGALPGRQSNYIPVDPNGVEVVLSHWGAFVGTRQDGTTAFSNGIHGCCGTTSGGYVIDPIGGTFYAAYWTILSAVDGSTLWNQIAYQQGGPWAIDATYVYVISGTQVRRFLRTTHALQWNTTVPIGAGTWISAIAVTADSGAVVSSQPSNMLAYVAPNGALAWVRSPALPTAPVITPDGLAVVGHAGAPPGVIAFKLSDGSVAWTATTGAPPTDVMVADDGVVYAVAGTQVVGIDAAKGTPRHLFSNVPSASEALLRDGRIYVAGANKVTAFPVPAPSYAQASPWPVRHHDNQRTNSRVMALGY